MKRPAIIMLAAFTITSCNKIEETVSHTVTSAKEKAQQKTDELLQETVNGQLNKLVNAEAVTFDSVFAHQNNLVLENESGKKVSLPNGNQFYVFKYKTSDKDLLLTTLVSQPTTDEAQSSKEFQKVDGTAIVEKVIFFEKFLPAKAFDLSFLDDLKNDKRIEYYKIKRFPNTTTLIYNPKTQMVYQFVEVKK